MTVLCVFAHPDDEAFGPGGTIATLARKHEVYLICVTNGDAGQKGEIETEDLGQIRRLELHKSAEILGVKQVFFLDYGDGTLANNLYHEIAGTIENYVTRLKPDVLLTFELRGISGHLDHIAVSLITSYVFANAPHVKKLMYYCLSEQARALQSDYFIYFPPGYAKKDIDEVIDVSPVWEQKRQAMFAHQSQMHDVAQILAIQEQIPHEEYFQVIRK